MATEHEIIGEEWAERAGEFAHWALENLVNRNDMWAADRAAVAPPSTASSR